jgi:hypothetical protein
MHTSSRSSGCGDARENKIGRPRQEDFASLERAGFASEGHGFVLDRPRRIWAHRSFFPFILALGVVLNGCSTGPPSPSISQQPISQFVTVGQSATFSVAATGTPPLKYQWHRNGIDVSDATSSTLTVSNSALTDDGAQFNAVVSNAQGSVNSSPAILSVQLAPDVQTFHNDNSRTGQNLRETFLTPANVTSNQFGLLETLPVDGKVAAQPLFLGQVNLAGLGMRNVLYAATEHDTVYAFDASTGAVMWQKSMLGAGETTSDDRGCSEAHTPEIGITATPVIDRTRGPNGTIYVQAMSKDETGNYHQRLHALDLTNGDERPGSPVETEASVPGTGDNSIGGNVVFDPKQYFDRAALLLVNGVVYTTWASNCDGRPYTGWIIGYDASSLAQTQLLNITPNGSNGAIWMSGSGPAADGAGNIYLLDANGTFDTTLTANGFPNQNDFGNCFLKLSTSGQLAVNDYFTMYDTVAISDKDGDLGSGGVILLPDLTVNSQVLHLALGGGKDGTIYVVNRDNMGHFDPDSDSIYQELLGSIGAIFSAPAYFQQTIYYGSVNHAIKAFAIQDGRLTLQPTDQTANPFPYPGATPSISAAVDQNPILWAVENNSNSAVLHAYDALNLSHELYNSTQAPSSRDQFGLGNKFITPTIANGRVYVGTTDSIAVFGLLAGK